MSPAGPIVWARDSYEKTGIEPYVHPSGSRVPSLRRLYKKRPYFTNGSAADLDDVLARAGTAASGFSHAGIDGSTPLLGARSRAALRAFLDLL
jgi:cytochrome c peroxidase